MLTCEGVTLRPLAEGETTETNLKLTTLIYSLLGIYIFIIGTDHDRVSLWTRILK